MVAMMAIAEATAAKAAVTADINLEFVKSIYCSISLKNRNRAIVFYSLSLNFNAVNNVETD